MSDFLDTHGVSFAVRMRDALSGGYPSMTFWVVPAGATDIKDGRILMRTVFSTNPAIPNAIAFYYPDGSALLDTSETGVLPSGVKINPTLNAAWTGDASHKFMDQVAELVAAVGTLMIKAFHIAAIQGLDPQDVFDQLRARAGLGLAPTTILEA